MFNTIKAYLRSWFKGGIALPLQYDPVSKAPSVTLTCVYATFIVAVRCFLMYQDNPTSAMPTLIAIGFWALSMVFYLIRKITRAKFDLDQKSFEIDSGDNEPESSPPKAKQAEGKQSVDDPDAS